MFGVWYGVSVPRRPPSTSPYRLVLEDMLGVATLRFIMVFLRLHSVSVCLKYIGFVNYGLSYVYHLLVRQGFLTVGRVGRGPLGDGRWTGVREGVEGVAGGGCGVSSLGKGWERTGLDSRFDFNSGRCITLMRLGARLLVRHVFAGIPPA